MKKKMRLQIWLYASSPRDVVVMKWLQQLQNDKQDRPRVKDHVVAALVKAIEQPPVVETSRSSKAEPQEAQPYDDRDAVEGPLPPKSNREKDAFPNVQKIKF